MAGGFGGWSPVSGGGGGASTWTMISRSVVGSGGAASWSFAAIPDTYEQLIIDVVGRSNAAVLVADLYLRFNGDSGNNYDTVGMYTTGTTGPTRMATAAGTSSRILSITGASSPAGRPGGGRIVIPAYARTTFHQAMHATEFRFNGAAVGDFYVTQLAALWRSAAAVTSVTLTPSTGSLIEGSVATLYGVS